MESQEVILAKLVLGYLKSEKCKTAYREFLKNSSSLQQLDISYNKFIATRFLGLTLEDILIEYTDISQIVQGRLEATNYYHEAHLKESLVDQLLYLLNNVPSSRPSSPGYSTPRRSHAGDKSPSHIDHSDLDATRADALPGNAPNEKTPRHKSFNRYENEALATSSPIEKQNISELFNTEVLAENLLENREFHEKIAKTINKVVERQLDSTVKEIVQETEQDPIFDKILEEIIGTSNNMLEISKKSESNNSKTSTTNISQDKKDLETAILNSQKNGNENQNNIGLNVDFTSTPIKDTDQHLENNQVINLPRNIDNYHHTSQGSATTNSLVQNPLYINTVTGLLIPPITTVVLNHSQLSPVILTEQDIMKMPIILNDDTNSTQPITKKKGKGKSKQKKNILPHPKIELAPDAPEELKEYFTNYRPEDSSQSASTNSTGLKHVIFPKSKRKSPYPVKKAVAGSNSNISSKNNLSPICGNTKDEIIEILSSEHKIRTPSTSDLVKKTTPKSGSHIRNLDFSTPPKLTKRRSDSSKSENEQKKAVKTLFKQKDSTVWDADLRFVVREDVHTTPKKKVPIKKTRKRPKKTKLDTTEQEGRLLEAAIRTPLKNEIDHKDSISEKHNEEPEDVLKDKQLVSEVEIVLSPSKLNASKNSNIDTKIETKFITPDMVKENVVLPIKANRNITPMLETPFKVQQIPKTPGLETPIGFKDDCTPFTKMLDANLNGMDINSIETPTLNTPGFPPNTPCIDLMSPYANRPTDYSTGSSYYQPSDNEQNKILEAQVREVEKTSGTDKVVTEITVTNHLKVFNKNIIGKKNLNLIKNSSQDSDHSCSSSEEQDSSIDWCEKESNDTIIFKKKTEAPKRTYSLRTRSKKIDSPVKKALNTLKSINKTDVIKKDIKKTKNKRVEDRSPSKYNETTEPIKNILIKASETSSQTLILSPEEALSIVPLGVTASQFSVLKELEKKRLRTIKSFKSTTEQPSKPKRQANGKFKIKPIKVFTTKTGKRSESPRKKRKTKQMETLMSDLITSDDSVINLSLSEDENERSKIDKTASDVEAQNLIEGLKERGIHLMQNKTPIKKLNPNEIINASNIKVESIDRESFDKYNKEGYNISFIYDETPKSTNTSTPMEYLKNKEWIGKLYLESIDREIDIHLKETDFITLIDIKPTKQESENKEEEKNGQANTDKQRKDKENEKASCLKEKHSETNNEISPKENTIKLNKSVSTDKEDEDMSFISTGKEKDKEKSLSPKSTKKRRLSDDSESENSRTKMLKGLDVDSFLNKIHQTNCRPHK